jgi:hypothetical protein
MEEGVAVFLVIFLRIRNSKGVVSWMGPRREVGLLALYEGYGKFDLLFSSFNISQHYLVIIYKPLKGILNLYKKSSPYPQNNQHWAVFPFLEIQLVLVFTSCYENLINFLIYWGGGEGGGGGGIL